MIHRNVVRAVYGLGEGLRLERKAPPVEVLIDAERLECLVMLGYDPYFEGPLSALAGIEIFIAWILQLFLDWTPARGRNQTRCAKIGEETAGVFMCAP